MRFLAVAADYDGTLATDGVVDATTVSALERLRASGRILIMVTGRELPDLLAICSCLELFSIVVAENGAVLYWPDTGRQQLLAEPPPEIFVEELRTRGVASLSVGSVILATWHPHEQVVLETIRSLGLEHQVIFNKGAVMVLPPGVNKATGLVAALHALGISPRNVVGVGDAENDHAFLDTRECAVAVGNALPMVKQRADLVTSRGHGAGVVDLIESLLSTELAEIEPRLRPTPRADRHPG